MRQTKDGIAPNEGGTQAISPYDDADSSYSVAALRRSIRLGIFMLLIGIALTTLGIISLSSLATGANEVYPGIIFFLLVGAGLSLITVFGLYSIHKASRLRYVSYLEERRSQNKSGG